MGDMMGNADMQRSGKEEHTEVRVIPPPSSHLADFFVSSQGEMEYKAAQAEGYVEGTGDRVKGTKDKVMGKLTGDEAQEVSGASP